MVLICPEGRPSTLTDEVAERLLNLVETSYTVNQVARLGMVPHSTLKTWLQRGREDNKNNVDSKFAQFSIKFDERMGQCILKFLNKMSGLDSFQSTQWMLEKCFEEDFGANSETMREIRHCHNELMEKFNGKEVDPSNAHEKGSSS